MNDGKKPTLDDIDARIRAAREGADRKRRDEDGPGPRNVSGIGIAFRISIEFTAAVLVGVAIGYFLDDWLGTAPWLMVLFLLLGFASGAMNVYRTVQGLDQSVGLGKAVERKKEAERRSDDTGS
ncbi:ATP synthase protein I [Caenispirillum salinarum AK4]|uniref:ATP synthase protein I n=1 Tax=Caenispirillum salinarum AK4 TaxID=1238182 RepID=K9H4V6_9PROT|nr:AtpZ/AtpI family protein [Caenispirillum salinarum]EKV32592.1 ATP synthase protein I [Caenispirillum salinarum AK4]